MTILFQGRQIISYCFGLHFFCNFYFFIIFCNYFVIIYYFVIIFFYYFLLFFVIFIHDKTFKSCVVFETLLQ